MVTSILNDALLLRKDTPEKLQEYFKEINVTVFDAIFSKQKPDEAKQSILFILCAYSDDSPLVVRGQESKAEQDGICEYLSIPEFKRDTLIYLKDPEVRRAVTDYATQFCGEVYRSLVFMRIQLQDYQLAITNKYYYTTKETKDASGEVKAEEVAFLFDWKEHGKAQQQCNILAKQIEALQKEIRDKVKRMDGIDDLKLFSIKGKETGKIKGARTGNIENLINKKQ